MGHVISVPGWDYYIDAAHVTTWTVGSDPKVIRFRLSGDQEPVEWTLASGEVCQSVVKQLIEAKQKGHKPMLKSLIADAKNFAHENREILYTIIIVLLIDQYVFEGMFRERIKAMLEKLVSTAEKKLETNVTTIEGKTTKTT